MTATFKWKRGKEGGGLLVGSDTKVHTTVGGSHHMHVSHPITNDMVQRFKINFKIYSPSGYIGFYTRDPSLAYWSDKPAIPGDGFRRDDSVGIEINENYSRFWFKGLDKYWSNNKSFYYDADNKYCAGSKYESTLDFNSCDIYALEFNFACNEWYLYHNHTKVTTSSLFGCKSINIAVALYEGCIDADPEIHDKTESKSKEKERDHINYNDNDKDQYMNPQRTITKQREEENNNLNWGRDRHSDRDSNRDRVWDRDSCRNKDRQRHWYDDYYSEADGCFNNDGARWAGGICGGIAAFLAGFIFGFGNIFFWYPAGFIWGMLKGLWSLFKNIVSGLWWALSTIASGLWSLFKNISSVLCWTFNNILSGILWLLHKIPIISQILSVFEFIFNGLSMIISTLWSSVLSVLWKSFNFVLSAFNFVATLRNVISNLCERLWSLLSCLVSMFWDLLCSMPWDKILIAAVLTAVIFAAIIVFAKLIGAAAFGAFMGKIGGTEFGQFLKWGATKLGVFDWFKDLFSDLSFSNILKQFKKIYGFGNILGKISNFIQNLWNGDFEKIFKDLLEFVDSVLDVQFFSTIKDFCMNLWNGGLEKVFEDLLSLLDVPFINNIKDFCANLWNGDIMNMSLFSNIKEFFSDLFAGDFNKISGHLSDFVQFISDKLNVV